VLFHVIAGLGIVPGMDMEQSVWDLPTRVKSIEELGDTARGAGGHGSTGR
jgi:dUTPase